MSFAAIDFETSYEKGRDIKALGVVPYLRHPQTDIYLVSIAFPDGTTWAGDPMLAPWAKIDGLDWVSHNRSFDMAVWQELSRRGYPVSVPAGWHCTADLMAYIQAPRALAKACPILLRTKVSKETRDEMRGKDYRSLTPEKKREVEEYARGDALLCWMLWREKSDLWPELERFLSEHTTQMGLEGIAADIEAVRKSLDTLAVSQWEAEREIPWSGSHPVNSAHQLAHACRRIGIPPPASTDTKSDEFDLWAQEYATDAPFVAALQRWRRCTRMLAILRSMETRTIDGRLRYNLLYYGGHTGRWSGSAGLNMQNFPKGAKEGVDLRGCLIPAPGHKFVVSDLSQIEARVALWLAGDEQMLDRLRSGEDLYESHARVTMGYTDPRPLSEVNPAMRDMAKCRVLGLGFGLGPGKFVKIVKQWTGKDITETDARNIVSDFRTRNRRIVQSWKRLEREVLEGTTGDIQLPSGRSLRYFNLRNSVDEGWSGQTVLGDPARKLYGGKLFENMVQAAARDVLADKIAAAEALGIRVVLHVHDELVTEVPEKDAGEASYELNRAMAATPDWAPGLPVAAKTKVLDRYGK